MTLIFSRFLFPGPTLRACWRLLSRRNASLQREEMPLLPQRTRRCLSSHSAAPCTLSEPLSQQEQRVLRLLVAGQTYAEMAQALVVSPNTIKTKVSSIYRKLGVSRRAEAIAVTARLHLL